MGGIMGKAKHIESAPRGVDEIKEFILQAGSDNVSVFSGKFEGGVHCQQVPDEFAACLAAILATGHRIENYLEIGVAAGGTTYHVHHFADPETIILVDNNVHPKAPLRAEILNGIDRREIIGDSHAERVIAEVRAACPAYDLIIIDGDHSYPGVKADVENYLPCLADGGFLVFHDTCLPDWGVMQIVGELKEAGNLDFIGEYKSEMRAPLGVALFRKGKE